MMHNKTDQYYRTIVEKSPIAMAVHEIIRNEQGVPADYRFLAANAAFGKHTGLDHASIIGQTVQKVLPGIEETDFISRYGEVVDNECPIHFESYSKPLDKYYTIDAFKVGDNMFATLFTDITKRKQAEAQWVESEANNQAIIRAIQDFVFVTSKEGVFLDVRTSRPDLLLAQPKEIIGKSIADFLPPDITQAVFKAFDEVQRSGDVRFFEYDLESPSGNHTFEAHITKMEADRFLLVVRDVTERKQAYRELAKNRQLYKHLVENQTDLIVQTDLEGRFDFVSPSYCQMFGKSEDELIGQQFMPLLHEDDRAKTTEAMEKLFVPPYSCRITQRAMTADGWRWIMWADKAVLDDNDNVIGIVGVGRDVTKEKEAIIARDAMASQLTKAQQVANIGSWEYISASNSLTWSDQLYFIFGIEKQVFNETYEHFLSFVHEDDRQRIMEEYDRSIHNLNATYDTEHRIVHAQSGEVRWVHEQCRHERDSSGAVIRSIGIAQDITEQKHAEKEKEELWTQMLQAQKMECIGHLASGIAHDFNNLIMVIMGYGEEALETLHPDDPLRDDLTQIVEAGESATNLTRQLLAFSRKQTLSLKVLNLNQLVENLEKMLGRLIGEHIALELALSKDLGRILSDPGQLEQVMINLAVNARDAMPPNGGKLRIETANVTINHRPFIQLTVADNGCGMSKKTSNQIFDPFFTTKRNGKGTGLGLSTVHGIIKQSGGDITVCSHPNKGTSFEILFPQTEVSVDSSSGISKKTSLSNDGKHILLVEDAYCLRKLMERKLSKMGHIVTTAVNGHEALLLIKDHKLKPDLIITDVIMPNMNGKELVESLSRDLPNQKVLYMSGYTNDSIMPHGIVDSDTPFIQKPFSFDDLNRKIREILNNNNASIANSIPKKECKGKKSNRSS